MTVWVEEFSWGKDGGFVGKYTIFINCHADEKIFQDFVSYQHSEISNNAAKPGMQTDWLWQVLLIAAM